MVGSRGNSSHENLGGTDDFEEDPRYVECARESLFALTLGAICIVSQIVVAYALTPETADKMTLILGLPSWFFFGAFLVPLLACGAMVAVVLLKYRNIPLDGEY